MRDVSIQKYLLQAKGTLKMEKVCFPHRLLDICPCTKRAEDRVRNTGSALYL